MPTQLVTVEGIIGAGKTTAARHIANTLPDTKFFPAPGRSKNPHWEAFNKNPREHGLALQSWFLRERLRVYLNALRHMKTTLQSVILDFSLWSDETFAVTHYENGFMTAEELAEYRKLMNKIVALNLPPPHLTIVLHATPDVCLQRAEGLERPMLTMEYLRRLDELHRQRYVRDLEKVFTPYRMKVQRVPKEAPGLAAAPSLMTLVRDWSDLSTVKPTAIVDAVMCTEPTDFEQWMMPYLAAGFAERAAAIIDGASEAS
jgi:deoxyadenosine/deoxycytidine kinase